MLPSRPHRYGHDNNMPSNIPTHRQDNRNRGILGTRGYVCPRTSWLMLPGYGEKPVAASFSSPPRPVALRYQHNTQHTTHNTQHPTFTFKSKETRHTNRKCQRSNTYEINSNSRTLAELAASTNATTTHSGATPRTPGGEPVDCTPHWR